jgi:hypothetical protein
VWRTYQVVRIFEGVEIVVATVSFIVIVVMIDLFGGFHPDDVVIL